MPLWQKALLKLCSCHSHHCILSCTKNVPVQQCKKGTVPMKSSIGWIWKYFTWHTQFRFYQATGTSFKKWDSLSPTLIPVYEGDYLQQQKWIVKALGPDKECTADAEKEEGTLWLPSDSPLKATADLRVGRGWQGQTCSMWHQRKSWPRCAHAELGAGFRNQNVPLW